MTVSLPTRSISMILMVPDVDGSTSSSPILGEANQSSVDPVPSMPVYQGSIVCIERHSDDENTSDLIIRVPNVQRLSPPFHETDTKPQTPIKRRAPICPVMHNSIMTSPTNRETRVAHANRLTTGLRSLSRAFTHSCRSKRAGSITEITLPCALPDVEVIIEPCEAPSSRLGKSVKAHSFTTIVPKMTPPKILFVKRKDLTLKKRQASSSSSGSSDRQPDLKYQRTDLTSTSTIVTTNYAVAATPKVTSFLHGFVEHEDDARSKHVSEADEDDQQQELESTNFSYEVEQQIKAISQLVSDHPVSSIDADSLSTHRYSSISIVAPDHHSGDRSMPEESSHIALATSTEVAVNADNKRSPKPYHPFCIQTSLFQPDISVIRIGTSNLATAIDSVLPGEGLSHELIEEKEMEQDWPNIAHSNEDLCAECYEVTYQIDANAQLRGAFAIPFQITLDPSQYRDLVSWAPTVPLNAYEKIERDTSSSENHSTDQQSESNADTQERSAVNSNEGKASIKDTKRSPTHSANDLSQTGQDQTSADHLESITDSSSSDRSSWHCTLERSNSYDGFGVYIGTDVKTHRDHFIHQVEQLSPGDQAGLKDHDRILCINGTPVVDEDYTVVLQLIKHGLETDALDFNVMANEAYE